MWEVKINSLHRTWTLTSKEVPGPGTRIAGMLARSWKVHQEVLSSDKNMEQQVVASGGHRTNAYLLSTYYMPLL